MWLREVIFSGLPQSSPRATIRNTVNVTLTKCAHPFIPQKHNRVKKNCQHFNNLPQTKQLIRPLSSNATRMLMETRVQNCSWQLSLRPCTEKPPTAGFLVQFYSRVCKKRRTVPPKNPEDVVKIVTTQCNSTCTKSITHIDHRARKKDKKYLECLSPSRTYTHTQGQ